MTKPQQRLAQIGVVALGGIAVLGWVREPEKHSVPNSAQRAIYQQQDAGGPPVVRNLPEETIPVAEANPLLPGADIETRQRVAVPRLQASRAAEPNVREYEIPVRVADSTPAPAERRSEPAPAPEHPTEAHQSEPELRTRPAAEQSAEPVREPEPRDTGSTKQPVAQQKQRSTKQTAMIIGGAAAAGAVIGGLAGGGKGAAIGAITGGAGGYIYDRLSRRKNPASTTYGQGGDTDSTENGVVEPTPLTMRFGTPRFAGQ